MAVHRSMLAMTAVLILGGTPRLPGQAKRGDSTRAAPASDSALANQGASLFVQKACQGCHTIGKGKAVGPDLAGVLQRRTADWLRHWLKAPDQMLNSDSTAKALLDQFNGTRMPDMSLGDKEIDALLSYIAREDARLRRP